MPQLDDPLLLDALGRMRTQTDAHAKGNKESLSYYDGSVPVRNLQIAIPARLQDIGVVSDWPSTVVDAYAERMIFRGWADPQNIGMAEISSAARVPVNVRSAVQDSLIFGVGFVALEDNGARGWQARNISPLEGTAIWDARMDEAVFGYRRIYGLDPEGSDDGEVLYAPDATYYLSGGTEHTAPEVDYVDEHGLPFPLFWRIRNKERTNRWSGSSLLSPAVRYYTQAAARTLLGMEYNREFYTRPQRWAKNATMDMFASSDNPTASEKAEAGWNATVGSFLTAPPPDDEEPPIEFGQFSASPPTPFVEQLRTYSQLMGSATGIPTSYLGFTTENPPSGDAIRAWQERLTRGCKFQQELISPDLKNMGWALALLNGEDVGWQEFATSVGEKWESPETQTLAADADAITKLVATKTLAADDDWIYDRLRVNEEERTKIRDRLEEKAQEERVQAVRDAITQNAERVADADARAAELAELGAPSTDPTQMPPSREGE